jgi:hypothetical protein
MARTARFYIFSVIAVAGLSLACTLTNLSVVSPLSLTIFTALTVLASIPRLRLSGTDGNYSLSFLCLLYGAVHFPLPETLIAGCAAAVAQSLMNAKARPRLIQILFNIAATVLSIDASYFVGRVWLGGGMTHYLSAVMASAACVYFIVNTVLISGVLSLLNNKPLAETCGQWYMWSFPCYLAGVTFVGLIPGPGEAVSAEAWLIMLPVIYLLHFFFGLAKWHFSLTVDGDQPGAPLPSIARTYLVVVVASGLLLLGDALLHWQSPDPMRFVVYLALGVLASTFKIRLPYVQGTLTPGFVLLLAAIVQLTLAETLAIAAVVGVVQVLWRSARRPMLAQVLFNPACLALSAAFAWYLSRVLLSSQLNDSLIGVLLVSTLVLYGSNSVIVAAMLALVNGKPLSDVLHLCYFWSLPYYLVGAAVAGIMTETSRSADWPSSLLVLPFMGLIYLSYRMQLGQAVARNQPVAA